MTVGIYITKIKVDYIIIYNFIVIKLYYSRSNILPKYSQHTIANINLTDQMFIQDVLYVIVTKYNNVDDAYFTNGLYMIPTHKAYLKYTRISMYLTQTHTHLSLKNGSLLPIKILF